MSSDKRITGQTPLVSIIIPAYNAEAYVGEAVRSCFGQTYRNLQIIVINDGSSDKTGEAVLQYVSDSRLTYVEQENRGVSAARNHGLDLAEGEILTFLDADDTLSPDTVEKAVDAFLRNENADWVLFPVNRIDAAGNEITIESPHLMKEYKYTEERVIDSKTAFTEMEAGRLPLCVWGGFYRKSRFNARFVNHRFEDTDILMQLLASDPVIAVITAGMYHYRHLQGSFINSEWNPTKWIDYTQVQLRTLETKAALFPDKATACASERYSILCNLKYLKRIRRKSSGFEAPLEFFHTRNKSSVKFSLRVWCRHAVKMIYATLFPR